MLADFEFVIAKGVSNAREKQMEVATKWRQKPPKKVKKQEKGRLWGLLWPCGVQLGDLWVPRRPKW